MQTADPCFDVEVLGDQLFQISVGYETIRLSKEYGPLIFQEIQIRADPKTCQWVIERAQDIFDDDGNQIRVDWIEVHRIEGQLPGEFDEKPPRTAHA